MFSRATRRRGRRTGGTRLTPLPAQRRPPVAQSIPPASDTGTRDFCTNFDTVATPIAAAIGLTVSQMTSYHGLVVDYNARLIAATDPSTRTKVTVDQKRISKAA